MMTTAVDICNRALDEIGARVLITDLTENTPQGKVASRQYDPMRQQILRTAPWGFARKTDLLTTIGLITDNPPASPYPWLAKYEYPADCLKFRYILPMPIINTIPGVPNVSDTLFVPWCMPSRDWRYLPAYDDTGDAPVKVILANIPNALGIYTVDVTDPDLWDALFTNALVMALANKFVMPLSGNVKLKTSYAQMAQASIVEARVADGNEAVPSTDHTPDWIAARGIPAQFNSNNGVGNLGFWNGQWDNVAWGM